MIMGMTEETTNESSDLSVEESNDIKPNPLQKVAMLGMMALVLLSFALANLQSIIWISSDWLVSTVLPAVVTEETNKAREVQSLPPLERNAKLDVAAQLKAEHMASLGYFSHWSPDGVSPWHWFKEANYTYAHAGENLAVHFTDSTAVVDAWLNSPTHRANIMNGNYSQIGIGTAYGQYEGFDTVFVVQMFGTPAVATPVAAVAPTPLGERENLVVETRPEVAGVSEVVVAEGETTVDVTDSGTVVYESYAATEVPGAVLAESDSTYQPAPSSFMGRLATSPRMALQIAYSVIGLIVLMLLLSALVIEWRRHHPVQMAYSAALLAVITILFTIHTIISGGAVIA